MIMLQNSQPGRLSDEMEKTIDELYYWRDLASPCVDVEVTVDELISK